MGKPTFSEDQLAGLTDEEREGLLDDSLVDDEDEESGDDQDADAGAAQQAAQAEEERADEEEGEDADELDADASADAGAGAGAGAADEAVEAQKAAASNAGEDEIQLDQRPVAWLGIEQLEERVEAFDQQLTELATRFDDGELEAREYENARSKIEKERRSVEKDLMRAQIRKDDDTEKWSGETVPDWLAKHDAYQPGSVLIKMLDAEVKKIQTTAKNPTDPKILDLAHARITAQIAKVTGQAPVPQATPKPQLKKTKREMPPTLGGVPAADVTDTDDGTAYAYLDRLQAKDTIAYEKELANMTPAQLDAYLAR